MAHHVSARTALFASAVIAGSLLACTRPRAGGQTEATSSGTPRSAEVATTAKRGVIESVEVPGDRGVLLVAGDDDRPIVHLHGMCSEPRPDLEAWASSVSEHGTVIALEADAACPDGDGRTWTTDAEAIDARITEAITAAGRARGRSLDAGKLVVIGMSMGAARATALAQHFPEKYTRLVLVGSPETPSPNHLAKAKAIALLAGEKEPQEKMRGGTERLSGAGIEARFWELAEATHGKYGPDGARAMGEAVGFVIAR